MHEVMNEMQKCKTTLVILMFQKRGKLKKVFRLIHFCSVESNQYHLHSHSTIMTYQTNPETRWPTTKYITISTIIWVEIFISSSSRLKMVVFTCFSNIVLYSYGLPSVRTRTAESD